MKTTILAAALLLASSAAFAQGGISRKSSASPQNSENSGSNATSVGVMKNQKMGSNNQDKPGGTVSEKSTSGQYRRGQTVDANSPNKSATSTGATSNSKPKSERRSKAGARSNSGN